MQANRQIAREISYAHSARSRAGRALIRVVENATGRLQLIQRAEGYEREVAAGRNFWQVIAERFGLSVDVIAGSLSDVPADGPLILIAKHPYGILDGLIMGHILSGIRGDFRIIANTVFRKAEDPNRVILPVSFDEGKAAVAQNLETRKEALAFLGRGGAVGIFPGGTVSTAATPFGQPIDPRWRGFTARMVTKSRATVVPVFFDGWNSRLFQMASHLHSNLRLALLISEFRARVDAPVRVAIGRPIARDQLNRHAQDTKTMMDFLRQETYALSPTPLESIGYGFEFDEKYRS
jgi:putative hemolysin